MNKRRSRCPIRAPPATPRSTEPTDISASHEPPRVLLAPNAAQHPNCFLSRSPGASKRRRVDAAAWPAALPLSPLPVRGRKDLRPPNHSEADLWDKSGCPRDGTGVRTCRTTPRGRLRGPAAAAARRGRRKRQRGRSASRAVQRLALRRLRPGRHAQSRARRQRGRPHAEPFRGHPTHRLLCSLVPFCGGWSPPGAGRAAGPGRRSIDRGSFLSAWGLNRMAPAGL